MILLLLSGCMFHKVEQDLKAHSRMVTIRGRVIDEFKPDAHVVAVLLDVSNPANPRLMNLIDMGRPGSFSFQAVPGHYRIFAYESTAGEQIYNKTDRIGRSEPIDATNPGSVVDIEIKIPERVNAVIAGRAEQIKSNLKKDIARIYSLQTVIRG